MANLFQIVHQTAGRIAKLQNGNLTAQLIIIQLAVSP